MKKLSALIEKNTESPGRLIKDRTHEQEDASVRFHYLELCEFVGVRPNPINGVCIRVIHIYISQLMNRMGHEDIKRRNARIDARLCHPRDRKVDLEKRYNSHARNSSCKLCGIHFPVEFNTERRVRAILAEEGQRFTSRMEKEIDKPDREYDFCSRCFVNMHGYR